MQQTRLERIHDTDARLFERGCALIDMIDEHYWQAREALEKLPKATQRRIHGRRYCRGYELDIDVYTRHWLHANGDSVPKEVIGEIRRRWGYEPEASRYLQKGKTNYAIPNP